MPKGKTSFKMPFLTNYFMCLIFKMPTKNSLEKNKGNHEKGNNIFMVKIHTQKCLP